MTESGTDAKSAILDRIGTALADRPQAAPIPRDYDTTRNVADVLALAEERIDDYKATVHRSTPEKLPELIAARLAARGARTMVAPAELPSEWLADGVTWLLDEPEKPLSVAELDGSDGVLTGCALTIAETGTIVLDAGPESGRRMLTLVPDYHLCVIRADQVVDAVPAAIARLGADRPVTFISGPSATSDIEFNRVEGVHGPRTLDVILVA
ncbi:MAG TPA: LUD domain-containing protein [Pseudonocardiaceae bacterium]|jgi:L-lactate dehydrogenase complex protein LldG|nr:LUD domain-containing protein [Pseudonocardiaceae bacterium]